jgi:hypothetical protein
MGNWRLVEIRATIDKPNSLRRFIRKYAGYYCNSRACQNCLTLVCDMEKPFEDRDGVSEEMYTEEDWEKDISFEYFSESYSLFGLNFWVTQKVFKRGTIGKNPSNDDIVREWGWMARKFPMMVATIMVGDDYESPNLAGKVQVENGVATWEDYFMHDYFAY